MSKFTFQCTDDDDTVVTVEFEAEVWLDAFPKFLQLCRGSGFIVDEGTALFAPTASKLLFSDRDFLIFEDDLACFQEFQEDPAPLCDEEERPKAPGKTLEEWVAEGQNPQRSDCYYDFNRNK